MSEVPLCTHRARWCCIRQGKREIHRALFSQKRSVCTTDETPLEGMYISFFRESVVRTGEGNRALFAAGKRAFRGTGVPHS